MIGLILLVLALGARHARLAGAGSSCRSSTSSPPSSARCCWSLALSAFVVDRMRRLHDRDTTARVMLLALVPTMLVMAQPDLGSGIVYVVDRARAPVRGRHAVDALRRAGGAVRGRARRSCSWPRPAVGVQVLKPYQMDRLTAFLHPSDDPRDQGYQQKQSQIAIGSGEKTGRGVEHATQTRLDFLPEHHTDFIFAVVGETYGFAGAALVLSLYALLIWRALAHPHDREEPVRRADRRRHRARCCCSRSS